MNAGKFLYRGCMIGITLILLSTAIVPSAAGATGTNYLVMYIVGSDLESNGNQATGNLADLADSWDPAMGDVLIIYGGAEKTGWDDGVAITNLTLLLEDFADGVIGSDLNLGEIPTQYVLKRMPGADISTPQTMASSLQYAEQYRKAAGLDSAENYLIFWNHGSGYNGYGSNEISGRMLSLEDLRTGLSGAGTTYDIIAFDACLMGSLEVANALYPYGTYLLASEEIVPGEGYDYNAFAALSASPGMSAPELGKTLIAYYLDQPSPAKTLSLVRLSEVPSVVAALNVFGEKLTEILDDPDSLAVLGSVYQDTQGFGSPAGDTAQDMMDIYQFADSIRQQTSEDTELHAAANDLCLALKNYVVLSGDDGHFSAANGVAIAAPVEGLTSGIPDAVSFDKSGWYTYLSTYMDYAGTTSQPHAAYTTKESARSIQVTDSTGTAWVTANYLYLNTDGQYLIVGDVPLKENWEAVNDSVWKTVPTGLYEEPDWDGSWFVFQNTDGTTVPATLTYKGPAVIDNRSHVIYTIEGNLTRTVHKNTVTAPSILTAVIDMENRSVSALSVTEKPDSIRDTRSNIWGNTTICSGDIFVPALQIYNEEADKIVVTTSPQSVTFGSSPKDALRYTALDVDNCYWMVELADFLDEETFYLKEPGMTAATPKPTQSSPAAVCIFAGVLIAGLLLKRT